MFLTSEADAISGYKKLGKKIYFIKVWSKLNSQYQNIKPKTLAEYK